MLIIVILHVVFFQVMKESTNVTLKTFDKNMLICTMIAICFTQGNLLIKNSRLASMVNLDL